VFGVRKDWAGGSSRLVVSDSLAQVFRFGVYALRDTLQFCPPEADVCRVEVLGRGMRAEVLLSEDILIDGVRRDAGTDVADHFDFFERDFLLGISPEPEPLFHVGFDPSRVAIPAGKISVTVRWVGGSTPFEATHEVTFHQGTVAGQEGLAQSASPT